MLIYFYISIFYCFRKASMKKIKSYYIIVIGCQMNEADGERISGLLTMRGLKPAKQRKLADLVVVVTWACDNRPRTGSSAYCPE
jgi:tRNA A37 methylthiotransferase MiaB